MLVEEEDGEESYVGENRDGDEKVIDRESYGFAGSRIPRKETLGFADEPHELVVKERVKEEEGNVGDSDGLPDEPILGGAQEHVRTPDEGDARGPEGVQAEEAVPQLGSSPDSTEAHHAPQLGVHQEHPQLLGQGSGCGFPRESQPSAHLIRK